jgi:hypothetical protein
MNEAHELIDALRELNQSNDRKVSYFTSSLVGMFGTESMFDEFLSNLDTVLDSGEIPDALKTRASNLVHTFIPQVAGFNMIEDLSFQNISADQLRLIRTDSPQHRKQGVRVILTALMKVLDEVIRRGNR